MLPYRCSVTVGAPHNVERSQAVWKVRSLLRRDWMAAKDRIVFVSPEGTAVAPPSSSTRTVDIANCDTVQVHDLYLQAKRHLLGFRKEAQNTMGRGSSVAEKPWLRLRCTMTAGIVDPKTAPLLNFVCAVAHLCHATWGVVSYQSNDPHTTPHDASTTPRPSGRPTTASR